MLCETIALNHYRCVADRRGDVRFFENITREVSKLTPNNPYAVLAKKLCSEATEYVTGKPAFVPFIPTTFLSIAAIENGLEAAYFATIANRQSTEVQKCITAAKKAIDALPRTQEKAKSILRARIAIINYLRERANIRKGSSYSKIDVANLVFTVCMTMFIAGSFYKTIQQQQDYIRNLQVAISACKSLLYSSDRFTSWSFEMLVFGCFSLTLLFVNSALHRVVHRVGEMPAWARWTRHISIDRLLNLFGSDPFAQEPIPNDEPNPPAAMPAAPVPGQPGYWARVGNGRNLAQN